MSLWEFQAAIGGVVKSRTPEDEQGITPQEAAALAEILERPPVWQ